MCFTHEDAPSSPPPPNSHFNLRPRTARGPVTRPRRDSSRPRGPHPGHGHTSLPRPLGQAGGAEPTSTQHALPPERQGGDARPEPVSGSAPALPAEVPSCSFWLVGQACFLRGSLCAPRLRARIPPRPRDRPAPGPSELGVWLPCLRAAGDPRGQHLGAVGLDQVTRWPRKPTSRLCSATGMLSPQAFSAVLMESEKWGWKFGKSTVIFLKCLLKSSEV